jgi:hypothetical protein
MAEWAEATLDSGSGDSGTVAVPLRIATEAAIVRASARVRAR